MPALAPVAPFERVAILDVLRGFALCGVLISNAFWSYSGRGFGIEGPTQPLDTPAWLFVEVFVSGKAMTLLTCLFGLGFAMQLARAKERGQDIGSTYVRRLAVLFIIGALHTSVLWWGDVTWSYAVAGLALLLFRERTERALLAWSIILTLVPQVIAFLPPVGEALSHIVPRPGSAFHVEFVYAIREGDFREASWAHVRQAVFFASKNIVWFIPWLIARFLLGYVAGRRGLFIEDGAGRLPLFRRLLTWGLPLGIIGTALSLVLRSDLTRGSLPPLPVKLAGFFFDEVGMLGWVAAYVAIVVFLMQRRVWRRCLMVFAPAGRMPLSTYLSQSVICTVIFYGWGLGMAGHVGATGCLTVALVIFGVQLFLCQLWLQKFRFGPVEWIWRTLVYGRMQPLRLSM